MRCLRPTDAYARRTSQGGPLRSESNRAVPRPTPVTCGMPTLAYRKDTRDPARPVPAVYSLHSGLRGFQDVPGCAKRQFVHRRAHLAVHAERERRAAFPVRGRRQRLFLHSNARGIVRDRGCTYERACWSGRNDRDQTGPEVHARTCGGAEPGSSAMEVRFLQHQRNQPKRLHDILRRSPWEGVAAGPRQHGFRGGRGARRSGCHSLSDRHSESMECDIASAAVLWNVSRVVLRRTGFPRRLIQFPVVCWLSVKWSLQEIIATSEILDSRRYLVRRCSLEDWLHADRNGLPATKSRATETMVAPRPWAHCRNSD